MENKPIRYERDEENKLFAVFQVMSEDKRPVESEDNAENYYNGLMEKYNNARLEYVSLEEQINEFEEEIASFGDVFKKEEVSEELQEEQSEEESSE